MWVRTFYSVKCPRSDCAYYKTDAKKNPCLGCTCNQWVEGMNRAFRYKATELPERKETQDAAPR